MTKAEKQKRRGIIVRTAQTYNQPWRGFTLLKGHLFGQDEKGYFVSAAQPCNNPKYIHIYRCDISTGNYIWHKTKESIFMETGRHILEAAHNSPGVEGEPIEKQIEKLYNPRLVTGRFTPMPNMRIPGGTH